MRHNIAVLMTVHNRKEGTLNCISHFYANTIINEYDIDFYMVDDGCTDGTAEAVNEKYPQVTILKGNGNLFWNRGMHFCWSEAMKKHHDYYLWLNDDTILFCNALETLLKDCTDSGGDSIITGCCCDTKDPTKVTYGGSNNRVLVAPNGNIQEISMMNGNCVLVPSNVCERIGILDPFFLHKAGDNEYGYRAQNNGIKTYASSSFIGSCDRHDVICKSYDPRVSLKERIKHSKSALGPRPKELFYLYRKSFGIKKAIQKTSLIYLNIYVPSLTNGFLSFRKRLKDVNIWNGMVNRISILLYHFFDVFPCHFSGYILMYHEVVETANENICRITPERFRDQLLKVQNKGYAFVTMNEIYSIIKENKKMRKFVALSFDDVSESVYLHAFPILKSLNIPFIIYLSCDLIDRDGFVKEKQINEMMDSGLCTIGSHGITHKMFSTLSNDSLDYELKESKKLLEAKFKVNVEHFAYPYGKLYSIGTHSVKKVKQYYLTSATSIPVKLNMLSHLNTHLLGRIVPEFNNSNFLN